MDGNFQAAMIPLFAIAGYYLIIKPLAFVCEILIDMTAKRFRKYKGGK